MDRMTSYEVATINIHLFVAESNIPLFLDIKTLVTSYIYLGDKHPGVIPKNSFQAAKNLAQLEGGSVKSEKGTVVLI